MLAWVDHAEALGLHSIWMPEMHFAPGVTASPLLALAGFAARTRRLRLATTSLLLPIHHPLRMAGEIAALDHLSEGRLLIGLGRGFRKPLFEAFGIDPATKRDRFDAALDLMLAAWEGEATGLEGTIFDSLPEPAHWSDYRPHQAPHPPLAVAAFGRKGLAQSARRGLPYLASPMEPLSLIEENLDFHQEAWAASPEARGDARAVVPIMRTLFVSEHEGEVERVRDVLEREARAVGGAQLPKAIARAASAPVSERAVVGGLAEVVDRLGEYRQRLGMNLLVVRPGLAEVSADAQRESLALLQEEVLPRIA